MLLASGLMPGSSPSASSSPLSAAAASVSGERFMILLKKFQVSKNRSFDGVLEKLNSRRMTEGGVSIDEIDDDEESSDLEDRSEWFCFHQSTPLGFAFLFVLSEKITHFLGSKAETSANVKASPSSGILYSLNICSFHLPLFSACVSVCDLSR